MLMDLLMDLLFKWIESCEFERSPEGLRALAKRHPRLVARAERIVVREAKVPWRDRRTTVKELETTFQTQLADDGCCQAFCDDLKEAGLGTAA